MLQRHQTDRRRRRLQSLRRRATHHKPDGALRNPLTDNNTSTAIFPRRLPKIAIRTPYLQLPGPTRAATATVDPEATQHQELRSTQSSNGSTRLCNKTCPMGLLLPHRRHPETLHGPNDDHPIDTAAKGNTMIIPLTDDVGPQTQGVPAGNHHHHHPLARIIPSLRLHLPVSLTTVNRRRRLRHHLHKAILTIRKIRMKRVEGAKKESYNRFPSYVQCITCLYHLKALRLHFSNYYSYSNTSVSALPLPLEAFQLPLHIGT